MAEPNVIGGILGGALIGIAASLLLLLNGRIAGISGIFGTLVAFTTARDRRWRLAFVLGLVAGSALYAYVTGSLPLQLQASGPILMVAGLCVGIGTRVGSGCTSGHGVCGLARRSRRSFAATATFMAAGALTVYLTRHLLP